MPRCLHCVIVAALAVDARVHREAPSRRRLLDALGACIGDVLADSTPAGRAALLERLAGDALARAERLAGEDAAAGRTPLSLAVH